MPGSTISISSFRPGADPSTRTECLGSVTLGAVFLAVAAGFGDESVVPLTSVINGFDGAAVFGAAEGAEVVGGGAARSLTTS